MGSDWPPLDVVEGLFGSVEAAVRAAGVEPRHQRFNQRVGREPFV
jgi:hypothetical protein